MRIGFADSAYRVQLSFFMANPITETLLPFVFLTVALGFAATEVHRSR